MFGSIFTNVFLRLQKSLDSLTKLSRISKRKLFITESDRGYLDRFTAVTINFFSSFPFSLVNLMKQSFPAVMFCVRSLRGQLNFAKRNIKNMPRKVRTRVTPQCICLVLVLAPLLVMTALQICLSTGRDVGMKLTWNPWLWKSDTQFSQNSW